MSHTLVYDTTKAPPVSVLHLDTGTRDDGRMSMPHSLPENIIVLADNDHLIKPGLGVLRDCDALSSSNLRATNSNPPAPADTSATGDYTGVTVHASNNTL